MVYNPQVLKDILVCPRCRSKLSFGAESIICTEAECRLHFPVTDGIPVMLIDDASQLGEEEWKERLLQTQDAAEQGGAEGASKGGEASDE